MTRDRLTGETWIEVKPPGVGLRIVQISAGTNAVWCVTNDNHVWFRRGIRGDIAGISEDAAIGNGWVEMVGNISNVSVAANDQVFAVGSENRALYFRAGVSESDLTGKKWRQIQCPMQLSRTCSIASLTSRNSGRGSPGSKHRSLNSLVRYQHPQEQAVVEECAENTSRSAPTANQRHKPELWKKPLSPPDGAHSLTSHSQRLVEEDEEERSRRESTENVAMSAPIAEIHEVRGRQSKNQRSWSPIRSVGSVVGTEALPDSDIAVFESDNSRDSGVYAEDDDHGGSQYWPECDVIWTGCSAGAVLVDTNSLPNWFNDSISQVSEQELKQPWRLKIIDALSKRQALLVNIDGVENYKLAVDTSSWVKTGEGRVAKLHGAFEDCLIELEWVSANGAKADLDSGTLTILNPDGVTTKIQFSLSEITCIMCQSEPGAPRLAIHAPKLPGSSSMIKLQFNGDTDMEDWLSHLTSACCKINNVHGRPSNNAIWTTSSLGDVFVFDPEHLKTSQYDVDLRKYVQENDLNVAETPYLVDLYNG